MDFNFAHFANSNFAYFEIEESFGLIWVKLQNGRNSRANFHFGYLKAARFKYCRFSYAGNWELVKSIVGTKFRRSHVSLHFQAGNRL